MLYELAMGVAGNAAYDVVKKSLTPADFTAEDIAALEHTRAPTETAAFNHEVPE